MNSGLEGRLSTRDQRALACGAVLMLLLVLLGRGVPRVREWVRAQKNAADALAFQVNRARTSVTEASRSQLLAHDGSLRLARYDSAMLAGRDPTIAGARLTELLAECASVAETQLGAVQLSSDSTHALLGHITARIEVTGDLESIAIFLDALEEGPELLAVRELDLAPDGSVAAPALPERLRAQILVEGIYRAADSTRRTP